VGGKIGGVPIFNGGGVEEFVTWCDEGFRKVRSLMTGAPRVGEGFEGSTGGVDREKGGEVYE